MMTWQDIKPMRTVAGLSQRTIGREIGCSGNTIGSYERGVFPASQDVLDEIERICRRGKQAAPRPKHTSCKGCHYRRRVADSGNGLATMCHYCYDTGLPRGCPVCKCDKWRPKKKRNSTFNTPFGG